MEYCYIIIITPLKSALQGLVWRMQSDIQSSNQCMIGLGRVNDMSDFQG
jgi:hypothetical protein